MRYTEINEGIKFREYEKPRSVPIDQNDAIKAIKEQCSEILDKRPIYRGIRGHGSDFLYFNGVASGFRQSANTTSYTNIMVDTLPEWHEYPKRSKSIICTTDDYQARSYGERYQVFPINGTKIGVCPASDFWFSFKYFKVMNLNSSLESLAHLFLSKPLSEDPNVFWQEIEKLDKLLADADPEEIKEKSWNSQYVLSLMEDWGPKSIKTTLTRALDPKRSGFELLTPKSFDVELPREVWLEGPAYLIHTGQVDILNNLGGK